MSTNSEVLTKRMNTQNWSADSLLARCAQDKDFPFYTEDNLRRNLNYSIKRAIETNYRCQLDETTNIRNRELRELIRYARLTYRQRDILESRLDGDSYVSIGRRWGFSKQAAQKMYRQAIRKLEWSAQNYPYAGLTEVYRSEKKRSV